MRTRLYEIGDIELNGESSAYAAAGKVWAMTGQLSFKPDSAAKAAILTAEIGWHLKTAGIQGRVRARVKETQDGDELILEYNAKTKLPRRLLREVRKVCDHLEVEFAKPRNDTIETVVKISEERGDINPALVWSAQSKVKRQTLIEQLYATLLERYAQAKSNLAEIREREKQLVASRDRLRRMSSELALTEEREKKRLATALHDSVLQSLSATAIKAKVLADMIHDDEGKQLLQSIRAELSEELQHLRSLTFEISPPILYELGLCAAVEWLGDEMQKQGIEFVLRSCEEPGGSDQTVKIMAFQCIREILANARKHSGARTVTVEQCIEDGKLAVRIHDDGQGFDTNTLADASRKNSRFGLMSIKERLNGAGGDMRIVSSAITGTLVEFEIPTELDTDTVSFDSSSRKAALV